MRHLCTPLAVAALAAGLAACGGGGESSDSTQAGAQPSSSGSGQSRPATTSGTSAEQAAAEAKARAKVKLGSPARVPRTKGGDNSIQDFGREASDPERAAAARVLAAYLAAYEHGDGPTACSLLSSDARERLEQALGQAAAKAGRPALGCARILTAFGTHLPSQARRQLTAVRLLSLRVEGDRAFAIYDAADQKAYPVPMAKESGAWRVVALPGSPLL